MASKLITAKETELLPLTRERYAAEKCLPLDWLIEEWHLKNAGQFISRVEMPYSGDYVRYRYANAKKCKPGPHVELYGQKQLIKNGTNFILLTEGESNTQTLSMIGYPVLGVPGVGNWLACLRNDPASLKLFDGCHVLVVLLDPLSKNGVDHPEMLAQAVADTFPKIAVVKLRLQDFAGDKDASDMWIRLSRQHPSPAEAGEAFIETINHAFDRCIKSSSFALPLEQREAIKQAKRGIRLVCAADVEMKLTKWLWPARVPLNKTVIFSGMPERGKSTVANDFIARLTKGEPFPDAPNDTSPCDVIILASEEDYDEDIVPRLTAAGADLKRVHFAECSVIEGQPDSERAIALDTDLDQILDLLEAHPNVRLISIDPVTSYIGEVDPNRPSKVRPFLDKIKKFAKQTSITPLMIMHFSKNPDVAAYHRTGGAATWGDQVRAHWMFDRKKDEDENAMPRTYVMVPGKVSKIADELKKSLEFTFTSVPLTIEGQEVGVGRVNWGITSDLTMEQQFGKPDKERQKPGPEGKITAQAMEWLAEQLATGEQYRDDLFANGEAHDPRFTNDMLYEAKKRLKNVGQRRGEGGRSVWYAKETDQL